ncbi:class I SAM-dependent methyltransferase [Halorientalis brevis]|uniref:Class I SAM-dependent methyltransferase n=1 Tax=Halorientalis brevis TaxID=1126241 RepID=A0ABD6CBH4_9EURY|nr:class I SAM-dependent methyltransferase [Halorientalis brevis]
MDDQPGRDGVRDTYDRIAPHFSQTREYPWPEVETFLEGIGPVTQALDVGCGNGRHSELLASDAERVLGLDVSHGLLDEARTRVDEADVGDAVALVQGDASTLPLCAETVDVAVYVATLHHLPERQLRVASLDELARVLAADGRALVSTWSTAHDRFDADEGFDTTVDWTLPGGECVPRYYHIYDPEEFRADLAESALEPLDVYVSSGNCYAEVTAPEKGNIHK